ncbi:NADH-quinone oxidoreductase subunit A [Candidatus Poribacteria bacterium]|nr:NADH-quinone oxidoreductase subunit A [Candidatus Poribacteria bacterium]
MTTFSEYAFLGGLLLAGVLIGAVPLVIPLFITPRTRGEKTKETYECGMDTIGSAWVRFGLSYYLFALIFVAFEVDVLYLLPVAVVFDSDPGSWRDLIEIALFIGILALAILYAWRKGVFTWEEGRTPSRELEGIPSPQGVHHD